MRPANDKTQSLRYLLIRHAWRKQNTIPDSIFSEVTSSINVDSVDKGFLVRWVKNGINYEKKYRNDEFKFFIRGDKVKDGDNYTIDYSTNKTLAESFIKEVFGTHINGDFIRSKKRFSINPLSTILNITILLLLILFNEKDFIVTSIILLIFYISEVWIVKGAFFMPILMLGLFNDGLQYTALLALSILLVYFLIDNNRLMRKQIIILTLFCITFVLFQLIKNDSFYYIDYGLMLISSAAICTFIYNWFHNYNFRMFPLTFPFLPIGIYFDGFITFSLLLMMINLLFICINYVLIKTKSF